MNKPLLLTVLFFMQSILNMIYAQDIPAKPTMIREGVFRGISKPLRDNPPMSAEQYNAMVEKAKKKAKNTPWEKPTYPFASTTLPNVPDEVWQKSDGSMTDMIMAPIANFEGQNSPYYPPDCNGATGPNHYMQTVNTTYAIYSKTGTLLAGPTNMNLLFGNVTGANNNDGDPIILYDEQAQRWVAVEFSVSGSNDYMLFAVSTTNDPTGTWYQYSFDVVDMPDYEKIAVWRDGYYMGTNTQPATGNDIYVFERSQMLIGGTARMVAFDNPYRPGTGVVVVPPVDNDGVAAPVGTPGTFIAFNDNAVSGGTDQLWLYELAVNWTTPASSTFNRTQQINVAEFDSQFANGWDNITQPGTSMKLCAISTVIMNVPQYRNFGTYQSIVCCHTVDVGTDHAGVRWYELRKTPPATTWTLRQQGTYAPDGHSRWMGSVAMNGSGRIAAGYSISSSTVYPGIRYAAQSASAYASASGILDIPEVNAFNGSNYQYTYNRWGDYSSMSIDPSNDQTFWFTTEYIGASEARNTKIISFQIGNNPGVVTLPATAVTGTSATLNGTVNPNGLATTYHFEYGTTIGYGNSTSTISAGSGTSDIAVNANISGLIAGTPYHFRLVAVNSDGTTNGNDLTFTPGGAVVTTTSASSITETTATSGGNVTSDGGTSVTARGVCWAMTADPIATGNHTTNGSGTGSFTSSITGLSANTMYHVRAYATNANGTFYGEDLTFTTSCGTISTFPWNEGFENGGMIPNCWTQEQVASSGIDWTFISGNGGSNPSGAHTGTYNACLKDNSSASNLTKLITPPINLSGLSSPTLTFWHTQAFWSPDQDQLIVYYRTSLAGPWISLATYTSSVTAWTQRTISLPAASGDYYIAFEGNAKYGYGVCVDDVAITGTSTPTLAVSPANQSVSPAAGSSAFTVTSNSSWTVASNQSWCTVTPSGSGNGTITATYTVNNTASVRVANVTVTVTGLSPVVVTVTQAAPSLAVAPSNQAVSPATGSANFTVTSNTGWTAASNQSWCTVTPSGNGNGTITATYAVNNTASVRVANVTVTAAGLSPVVVTVTQAAPSLTVTPTDQSVSSTAGNTSFSLTSNTNWTAYSNQNWCTVTLSGSGNGTIIANYTANVSEATRIAEITVTVGGLTPVTVTVTQAGLTPLLSVTPGNQSVSQAAGNTTFTVTSNTSWTAISDQPWCTATPSGSGNGLITASYPLNTNPSTRVANITVTASGLSPVIVTVTQAGSEFLLTLQNIEQTAPNVFEFDLYLLDVDASAPLQLATIQEGIIFNQAMLNGATQTADMATIVPNSSDLPSAMQPNGANTSVAGLIRIAGRAAPGAGNGYIVSTVEPGTHITRIRFTNSIPFAPNSLANMVFTSSSAVNPMYATRVAKYEGTVNTQMVVTPGENAIVMYNPILNGPPTLDVTPANQDVAATSGSTSYAVASNAAWSVISDQTWCTVTPSGFGNGIITATYDENTGATRTANITVSVTGLPSAIVTLSQEGLQTRTLNVNVLLEGLYAGGGTMNQANNESGPQFAPGIADKIDVELHNALNYSFTEYVANDINLSTSGFATILFPPAANGNYYLTIKHRNSIETTSANPVSFALPVVDYSFDLPAKAYGGNLLLMIDGYYAIFGGDVNQDGSVDSGDTTPTDNDQYFYVAGYILTDINGDGIVDTADGTIIDNNQFIYVGAALP
jgi:hypothetical protein